MNDNDCPICYDILTVNNVAVTQCGHAFHLGCLLESLKRKHECPMCRGHIAAPAAAAPPPLPVPHYNQHQHLIQNLPLPLPIIIMNDGPYNLNGVFNQMDVVENDMETDDEEADDDDMPPLVFIDGPDPVYIIT